MMDEMPSMEHTEYGLKALGVHLLRPEAEPAVLCTEGRESPMWEHPKAQYNTNDALNMTKGTEKPYVGP